MLSNLLMARSRTASKSYLKCPVLLSYDDYVYALLTGSFAVLTVSHIDQLS